MLCMSKMNTSHLTEYHCKVLILQTVNSSYAYGANILIVTEVFVYIQMEVVDQNVYIHDWRRMISNVFQTILGNNLHYIMYNQKKNQK